MVLWHLADRWGTTSAAGVELELPSLSHRVLAEMLGARRPTVSLAVRRLAAAGFLTHVPRQGWTLHARPEAFPASAGRRERARAGPPA
nr:helix-turn-helix domain-containing protein [Conexibacter arvalis]